MEKLIKIEGQQNTAKAATAKADALSLKLYHLTKIARLAAFAAEARRTLKGIENVKHFQPEMQEAISEGVPDSNNRLELEDASGEVLSNLARELEKINIEFTETVFDLARAKTGSTEAEQIGGAA